MANLSFTDLANYCLLGPHFVMGKIPNNLHIVSDLFLRSSMNIASCEF